MVSTWLPYQEVLFFDVPTNLIQFPTMILEDKKKNNKTNPVQQIKANKQYPHKPTHILLMAALLYLGNFQLIFRMMTKFLAADARKPFRWLIPTFIRIASLQVPAGKENCLIFFHRKMIVIP